jgi:hypothetical protein
MNNLSAFTDVINGIRQAIFTLNSQIHQLRIQLDEVKNREQQGALPLTEVNELKSTLFDFKQNAETKLNDLSSLTNDVEKLKTSFAEIDIKVANALCNCNSSITEGDVQNLINKSISQLLEGVQPLSPLLKDEIEPTLPSTETSTIIVEPPVIAEELVAQSTKTTKKNSRKKS